ncbi:hypothetical protein B0H63DRAFT_431940 [Podospora didyma]|uniref:WSC domain-containing protein n=1 Tax=Podospora didyma TaxID=330526 RepID=A0AAE0NUV1_9PEZI|nr:hypothetical protein B0H63DRAFT_431940 [Podospora didyma]
MKTQSLAVLSAFVSSSDAFLLMGQHIAHERVDPIVQPGVVSGHLHDVVGASTFGVNFDPAVWAKSNCSSMQVQENKSNYWMPSLMARNDNGTFSAIPLLETRVYYLNNHPDGTKVKAFPQGFRMLAGNPSATAPTGHMDLMSSSGFQCQNGRNDGRENIQPHLPYFECLDFTRLTLAFPDCWDGINLDSPDHKAHVTYRLGNGTCPLSHPVSMMEIDLELGYWTRGYRWDQLLLSTGDQAGYGLHADYLSFWDVDLLQRALDDPTCQHRENIFGDNAQCQALLPYRNDAAMQSCKLEAKIPQEETGITKPIPSLPGCNLPWNATKGEAKPSCPAAPATPAIGPAATPQSSWANLGCYTDSTTNRGLPIQLKSIPSGTMTIDKCVAACASKGYTFAGVEYSIECFCGNAIGGDSKKANQADCDMKCSGDASQLCGGGNRVNVYAKAIGVVDVY